MIKKIILASLAFIALAACDKAEPGPTSLVDTTKPAPVADFEYVINSYGIATFTNKSSNAISYLWDFGDSNSENHISIKENPSYTYSRPGTYTVTLSVSNGYEVKKATKEIKYTR